MDLKPSPERQILFDTLTKYFENEYKIADRNTAAHSELGYSKEAWERMRDLGILESLIDPELNGFGGTPLDISAVFEALGRGLVVEPFLETGLVSTKILGKGNENQKKLVADLLENIALPTFCHSENDTDYRKSYVKTKLVPDKEGNFLVTGKKVMIKNASGASHLIITCRSSGDYADEKGITIACIPSNRSGIDIKSFSSIDGGRVSDIHLENVAVLKTEIIGNDGKGFEIISEAIDFGILAICSEALGIMEKIKELTLDYLKTRKQFGVPIGKFQALQHRMAQLLVEIEQARSAVVNATINFFDSNERSSVISAAKFSIGKIGMLVAEESIQLHGGMGMTWEYDLGHYAKRLVLIDHEFGDEDFHLQKYIELQ
jgi:alkylation response protein AidB-like acyl-CoA dehydrogenase|tara:strand:+ start:1030 stop:2154 length:1125 start_codon:yes stop_codon:yes gene_type:complete